MNERSELFRMQSKSMVKKTTKRNQMSSAINWFHILAVAPIIGHASYHNYTGKVLSKKASIFGMVLALLIVVFHAFKVWQKRVPETADNQDVILTETQVDGEEVENSVATKIASSDELSNAQSVASAPVTANASSN